MFCIAAARGLHVYLTSENTRKRGCFRSREYRVLGVFYTCVLLRSVWKAGDRNSKYFSPSDDSTCVSNQVTITHKKQDKKYYALKFKRISVLKEFAAF
jgi:hypothetical protein